MRALARAQSNRKTQKNTRSHAYFIEDDDADVKIYYTLTWKPNVTHSDPSRTHARTDNTILVYMSVHTHRPNPMGSSAMANSSVGALLPFFFFEYHKNRKHADALTMNTAHAIYTP